MIIKNILQKYRLVILYICIGGFSAGLDIIVFHLLTAIGSVDYLLANFLSVNIGITSSFILNRQYNFRVKDRVVRRLIKFYSVGIAGLTLSMILLWLLNSVLSFDLTIIKFITIPIIFLFQLTLNKLFTFKVSQ